MLKFLSQKAQSLCLIWQPLCDLGLIHTQKNYLNNLQIVIPNLSDGIWHADLISGLNLSSGVTYNNYFSVLLFQVCNKN